MFASLTTLKPPHALKARKAFSYPSLGVRPAQIKAAWMLEALTLGIFGSLAVVLLGAGLARISVGAVTETLGNLYVQG